MSERVNPEMLILAREAKGLTQTELATAVDMTQATISRYEAGLVDIPVEHIAVFAKALNRPDGFFLWREKLYGSSCLYHRKQSGMTIGELKRIHARVNILRMQTSRLLRWAKVESNYQFHRLDQQKFGGPVGCAQELRRLWQMPTGPIRNVVASIESAGGVVFRCEFMNQKVIGISQWPLDAPDMPPVFFVNETAPGDRERWTLCHEIGHIVMHHLPADRPEEDANEFASEFLMPAAEIGPELANITLQKAAAMKAYWKTSIQSIVYRAFQLGKIDDDQYKRLFRQLSAHGYRKCEPVPIPAEDPELFKELLANHRRASRGNTTDISEFLGEPEQVFLSEYWRNLSGLRIVG